jgi:hypothetical protein
MNLSLIPVEKLLNANTLVNAHLEVQDRYREAAMVLWRLPKTPEEGHIASSLKCSCIRYVRDWHSYGYERARMPKIPPQPNQIDRCDELLQWHVWLAMQDSEEAKICWDRFALRQRTKVIAHRMGIHRQTVRRKGISGIQRLVERFIRLNLAA